MVSKKLLGVLLALLLCSFTYRSPAADDPYDLEPVASAMMFPGVETTYSWKTCGFANAFYNIPTQHVTLCEELKDMPGFTPGFLRYVLAHEMAHGVIIQRDLGYTGSSEWAADELSSLVLVLMGHEADILDGAQYWLDRAGEEDPTDPHLGDVRRGYGLYCMVATKIGAGYGCDITYQHAVRTWVQLLGLGD